ncbi:MAG: hypothetical protein R2697_17350 [Ilumatobacteraceae bacterium]
MTAIPASRSTSAPATTSRRARTSRREIFAYQAYLTDPDTLRGTVTDDSEQLVIGASDPIFETATAWVQYPDLTKSPIILRRVDASWDCDRLAAERATLFPPTPEVDW